MLAGAPASASTGAAATSAMATSAGVTATPGAPTTATATATTTTTAPAATDPAATTTDPAAAGTASSPPSTAKASAVTPGMLLLAGCVCLACAVAFAIAFGTLAGMNEHKSGIIGMTQPVFYSLLVCLIVTFVACVAFCVWAVIAPTENNVKVLSERETRINALWSAKLDTELQKPPVNIANWEGGVRTTALQQIRSPVIPRYNNASAQVPARAAAPAAPSSNLNPAVAAAAAAPATRYVGVRFMTPGDAQTDATPAAASRLPFDARPTPYPDTGASAAGVAGMASASPYVPASPATMRAASMPPPHVASSPYAPPPAAAAATPAPARSHTPAATPAARDVMPALLFADELL